MAHRGRLNVLANIIGKSYGEIFSEFEGNLDPTPHPGLGRREVPPGLRRRARGPLGQGGCRCQVASNPSHLEAVDPVVEGIARAKQDLLDRGEERAGPAHPDPRRRRLRRPGRGRRDPQPVPAAGYRTGGTVHIVVNNQVGFTTSPDYGRSSTYATDVAKMIQAPIFHVNGDDPEACVRVARLAFEFRQAFKKDVVIDMWCYRRYGHNEADEPSFTQPLMYERIKNRRPVRKLYTEALVNRGDLSLEEAERSLEQFRQRLQEAFDDTHDEEDSQVAKVELERPAPMAADPAVDTTVDRATLDQLLVRLTSRPRRLQRPPQAGQVAGAAGRGAGAATRVDWALGEALAFGSLLTEGRTIRLSGQDTRRGTFSQRHAVLVDQRDRRAVHARWPTWARARASSSSTTACCREFAALGFEYGYSRGRPRRPGAVGGPVRRLRQRRPGHHRPVHRRPPRTSGASGPAWSCCCPTASRARARSTPAPASSGSSTWPPRTTSRSPTPPPRPSTSTCCAARRCGPTASRWW